MKRKILIVLLAIICAISCVVLVACNGGGGEQEALDLIVLEQTGTVQDPFTLPKKAGGFDNVVWTSSNPDALTVTEQQDTYLATPHLSDSAVDVTLTASLGSATKQFTLTVKGIDAWMFYDAFTFPQSNRNISSDFGLATSFSIDVTSTPATIAWEIKEGGDVAEIENGNHVKVTPIAGQSVRVRIQATFAYKTTQAQISYTFNVTEVLDHNALVDAWYNTPGQTIEISGYVVGRAQTYYSGNNYKNVSVYVVDEDGCHSFYFYAINFEEAQIAKLQPGVKVNVVGAAMSVASIAGNIIEGSGGTLTLDASETTPKTLQPYDAIDDDLMGEVPAVKYHIGGLVRVDNWTVKSIGKVENKDSTLFTLTKGGVDLAVNLSSYMEGFYYSQNSSKKFELDATATELSTKATSLKEGDVVTVTGVLSYHNGWQLLPRSADDIVTGADDGYKGANGKAAKSAIDEVNAAVASNGLNALVAVDKTVTLPATSNGVTITYRVCRDAATIAIEGNTLKITPAEAEEEDAVIEAAYTIGNYKTYSYFTVKAWKVSDENIVARVAGALNKYVPAEVTKKQTIQLPVGDAMSADLTIEWVATVDGAPVKWATIDAKGVLTITLPAEAATLHLKATVSLRAVTPVVKEYDISVSAAPTEVFKAIDAPAAGSEYYLAQLVNDEYYYATGSMVNTYYFGTSTDVADAATFELVADGDNWLIKQGARFVELAASEDGSHINAFYRDARTEGKYWTWDNTNKVFVWCDQYTNGQYTNYYTLGNYNTNTSISTQRVPLSSTGFAAKFGTMVPVSEAGGDDDEGIEAGRYVWSFTEGSNTWYAKASLVTLSGHDYVDITKNADEAGSIVVTIESGAYHIKFGDKYLEFRGASSKYVNFYLVDAPTAEGLALKWSAQYNTFLVNYGGTDFFPGANYDSNNPGTLYRQAISMSDIKYASYDNNFVATFTADTREPEVEHHFAYEWVSGSFTHKKSCTDADCAFEEVTEDCSPVNNVCEYCEHQFTVTEILDKLFGFTSTSGQEYLPGSYVLTGEVKQITAAYDSTYKNVSFVLTVENRDVTVFRAKGDEAANVKVGDTVTVQGKLVNYNGTKEFDSGCTITARTPGEGGDVDPDPDPTPVNHGTEEAPLSVEEFLALTDLPSADKEYSSFDVWVKGYIVTSVQGPSRGEYNLYISDVKGNAGTTVQVYWAASDQQPFIGDLIVVHGYIQKYGTKFELVKKNGNSSGTNVITISERAQDNVEVEITKNDNATISVDKQSGTNGQQVVITVTINQGYDFVKLTVDGVEITAKDSDGKYLAYIGDVTGDGKTTIELTVTLHVDKTYTLVENTDVLVEGAVVVFVYKYTSGDTTSIWLAGEMSGKLFTVVKDAATLSADGKSLSQVSTLAQEFTIGKSGEHYTFAVDENLVGITSTTNNNLSTSDSNRTTTWDITIKDGIATILSTVIDSGKEDPTCKLQCNTNANQERFSNYKTGTQKDFQLFLVEEAE